MNRHSNPRKLLPVALLLATASIALAGCSYATGRFDFDGFTGRYVENTRFPTKFKSNHTPGDNCLAIGTLQD